MCQRERGGGGIERVESEREEERESTRGREREGRGEREGGREREGERGREGEADACCVMRALAGGACGCREAMSQMVFEAFEVLSTGRMFLSSRALQASYTSS